jgi:hypothetical protein
LELPANSAAIWRQQIFSVWNANRPKCPNKHCVADVLVVDKPTAGHKKTVAAKPAGAAKGIHLRELLKQGKSFLNFNAVLSRQFFVKLKDGFEPLDSEHPLSPPATASPLSSNIGSQSLQGFLIGNKAALSLVPVGFRHHANEGGVCFDLF